MANAQEKEALGLNADATDEQVAAKIEELRNAESSAAANAQTADELREANERAEAQAVANRELQERLEAAEAEAEAAREAADEREDGDGEDDGDGLPHKTGNVRYITRPGGTIVALADGSKELRAYGDAVYADEISEVQARNWESFTTDQKLREAGPSDIAVADAHRRAVLAEAGQVNSTSSAVPGNYHDLDENGVLALFRAVEQWPGIQAQLYIHEKMNLGREKILASVRDEAKNVGDAILDQFDDDALKRAHLTAADGRDVGRTEAETQVHSQVPVGASATVQGPASSTPPPAALEE
jgi:hypothetical protein